MTSTALSDFPAIEVSAAFGTGVDTAASSWTDITTYVRGFDLKSASRSSELDLFDAGTATIYLDNRDRRFDPLYASGPYFGNLLPRVQVRVRAVWSAVTYDVWRGYVVAWPQAYPQELRDTEVAVQLVDGFGILARAPLKSVWQQTVEGLAPDRWYGLAETSGTKMGDTSGNGVHGTYEAGATFNHRDSLVPYAQGGSIEFNGASMNGTAAYLDSVNSTVAFWAKMPDDIPEDQVTFTCLIHQDAGDLPSSNNARRWEFHLNPGATSFSQPGGHLMYTNSEATSAANPLYSDVKMVANRVYFIAATYNGSTDILYINGVAQTEDGFGVASFDVVTTGALTIGGVAASNSTTLLPSWSGVLGDVLLWSSVLTANNIADLFESGDAPWDGDTSGDRAGNVLDQVGWPASLRDLDAGATTLGPAFLEGNALDYLQLLARTEAGLFYVDGAGAVTLVGRVNMLTESRLTTSQGTFGDAAGELPYIDLVTGGYSEEDIINVARASRQGGQMQEYRDATSVGTYGIRAHDDTNLLVSSDGEAYDRATWRVLARKDPHFRVLSITLNPRVDTSLWPHVLGREIGDRVTVRRRPLNVGTLIEQECRISGITHALTEVYTQGNGGSGGQWTTTWQLEAIDPNEDGWALVGVANVGQSDAHVAY